MLHSSKLMKYQMHGLKKKLKFSLKGLTDRHKAKKYMLNSR